MSKFGKSSLFAIAAVALASAAIASPAAANFYAYRSCCHCGVTP